MVNLKMRLIIFFYFLLLCMIYIKADRRVNKYVTTLIDAKWKETPLALEAAEYLNDENPSYFWKFIDAFANYDLRNVTEKENYDAVIAFAEKYLSQSEVALMKLGLSLRIYSARVEMFTQMAENKNVSIFDCYNVVDVGGVFTCSLEELEELASQDTWLHPDIYSVDHRYYTSQQSEKIIILYGQIGTPKFSDFHNKLKSLAENRGINYILRHYLKDRIDKNVRLSGYGVELQMKSTEYKATDDSDIKDNAGKDSEATNDSAEETDGINFVTLKNLYPDKQLELDKLQTHLLETSHEIGALKVWQFQELSHQAAERIMNSPTNEAINVLTDISQNFPMQAKSLIRTKANNEMKKEMKLNQAMFSTALNIQPTDTALFINGLFFDLEAVDVLSLLESLRSELRVMESLRKIGFSKTEMGTLLALGLSANTEKQEFAMDIRDSAIIWVNDIEQDSAYGRWSSSLTELLRPTFPGMLRNIRRNLYNLVLIIDPLSGESTPLITLAQSLYLHSVPLRVGFVFVTNYDTSITGLTDASVAVNNAYHYFAETKGSEHALQFLINLGNYIGPEGPDVEDVKKAIKVQDSSANINYILGEESEYDVGRHLANDFVKRSGFKKFPQALLNGVPLSAEQLNANSFEEAVLSTIMSQTPALQKAVYRGEITEGDDVVDYIMNQPNVMPRLNERILKPEKHTWLNLIGTIPNDKDYSKWSPQDLSTWLMDRMRYMYVTRRTSVHHLYTFWVVANLNDAEGRQLLREALEYIDSNADVRISVIINPFDGTNDDNTIDINQIVLATLHSLPVDKAIRFIRDIIKEDVANGKIDIEEEAVKEQLKNQADELFVHRQYVKTVLNLQQGVRAIVCNGRLIGPLDEGEEFTSEDFSLLERFSQSTYDDKSFKMLIKEQLLENDEHERQEVTDDMIMKITSLLASHPQTRSRFHIPFHGDEYSAIKVPATNSDEVVFTLIAIVDPVSRGAQKLGPILKTLQQSLNCNIKVFLNCLDKNSDMPLKSFYRFVFEPQLQFSPDGHVNGAMAKFTKLPTSSLLTQYIHAPENWLVEVVRSVYDLDNIKLVKKSTLKIQDVKKDSATRFKHLKIVLENVDTDEAKGFFEGNFSHVYFILYDCFVSAETNLRQRVHKAHREELEQVLQLLEKVLTLLPELLNRRWQCHSLARILQKLLHPGNSWKLRREAIRYFILWYQALGENAPDHIHQMFASLIPGFPPQQPSPYKSERKIDGKKDKLVKVIGCDDKDKKEFYDTQLSQSTFHDNGSNQCPVTPVDSGPILPPQSGEKPLDNETVRFLEALLEFMVTQVVKIEWRDKSSRQHKTFQFLLERFKTTYLRHICPEFDENFSLYKPNLELPTMRKPTNQSQDNYVLCKVALIKWIASFTHIARKDARVAHLSHSTTPNEENTEPELRRVSVTQNSADSTLLSPESTVSQQENQNQEDSSVSAVTLVRDVLYGNRDNVNFVHELYRQAFLLDFNHAGAIRKAIAVYKDWIQMNELPPFMLEPLDSHKERDFEEYPKKDLNDIDKSPSESYRQTRLRNDSYLGAIHRENLFIRAGLQNVLQVFITQASNVFFLENSGPNASLSLLEEQTDSCKRVLNVYRYVVMNSRLEPGTWEQLLRVLLQITSLVLNEKSSRRKIQESIGGKLAPAIFQTLIVTWIKANLNVVISTQLWDQFLEVLTSLTQWEELIREWAKTLDTLTRVLARHVYNLDLNDLPLDRLSEQKTKKRRGVGSRAASTGSVQPPRKGSVDQDNNTVSKENVSDHPMRDLRKVRPLPRSASDNTIYNGKARTKLHRNRTHTVHSGIPVLPLSIEQDMARLLSNGTTSSSTTGRKMLPNRRAKSLDSIVIVDSEPPSPRCPSPTPSSGVDSNKDSPIQIENIDGSSIDTNDASERRSVMAGGGVRGWLPDVAVVLWRRMLSALGDVNNIQDPTLHGQVMDYLVQLTQTLLKIRLNQGVSGDNQATPPAPELIPPLTVIAPWCFKAIQLPSQYEVGKLAAYRLICLLTVQPQDINLPKQHLTLFYRAVHSGIVSNDNKVLHVLVKYTGPRLFSLNLPGSSLLILDYIHAANVILSNQDIQAPRTEAVSIIGSLLSLPATTVKLPVLQPTANDIVTMTCPDAKEHIIMILLRSCRREPTGIARCVAVSSIAMFVYRELCYKNQHPRIPEAVTVLLLALKATHATVAQVACDSLLLLCDKADILLELYPNVPCKIIQILSETLGYMSTRERRGPLTISMLFCLGEWAMHLGPSVLLRVFQGKPLLMTLFTVLDNIVQDTIDKDVSQTNKSHEDEDDDFDPDITLDNLADDICAKSPRRGNTQSVQLAAKMVMMHLINHLGHFPMGIGAARLSSLVVELDDVPGIDGDELSSAIFHAPNIQLLMLSNSVIMSLVELAALDAPGGGVTAGLTTAPSLVRVLLRDLAGKASWDSSILYSQPFVEDDVPIAFTKHVEWKAKVHGDDLSSVITSQTCTPRHTIRHREPHILPTFANAASDMDNLDDLLQYIGHTSPEVLTNPEIALNAPANPPQGQYLESETIATILNQRNAEQEHINNWSQHISMCASAISPPSCRPPPAPFHHCRLLFSHLGLSGWEQRRKLHLLSKNEKLLRELRNLDSQRSRETHKIAVIYVSQGQEDKNSILSNVTASKEYESFIARLAWEVELESHTGFLGGLVPGKASGVTAPYFATSFTEILFHVATRMPSDSPESLLQKTRHLGNDEIHIVWSEHWRDYRRDIIPTEFCDVLIVIYPLHNKLYRIQISRKPEIPFFGPLFDECIVEDKVLPGLVRTTALAASRAKRSTLTLYQHYYEERARSIDTVMRNHKEATTFEEFTANVYSPVQPPSPFSGTSSVSGSTTSVQSTASSNLAAALIDSHQGRSGLRSSSAASSDNRANRVSDGSRVWFSNDTPESTALHGISPRPVKKMSFKTGPKQRANTQPTPPDSPRYK